MGDEADAVWLLKVPLDGGMRAQFKFRYVFAWIIIIVKLWRIVFLFKNMMFTATLVIGWVLFHGLSYKHGNFAQTSLQCKATSQGKSYRTYDPIAFVQLGNNRKKLETVSRKVLALLTLWKCRLCERLELLQYGNLVPVTVAARARVYVTDRII